MSMQAISPINQKNKLIHFLECKDYTVSNEMFTLLKDTESQFLITHPQPLKENLPSYYKSDSYISHTDSKNTFFDSIYQMAKSFTLKQKLKLINDNNNSRSKILLDIGCGTGDFLRTAYQKKWKVIGVEPNKKARNLAQTKIGSSRIYADITAIDKENQFDCITLWHVLEHLPNLEEYISNLKQLLKPNGRLLIAVPNYKSFDANHYKEFWAAYDVPRHLWHFSQKSIPLLFSKIDMSLEKSIPMKLDSFYVSLLSEKIKNGKSKPLTAFWIGLQSNFKAKHTTEYSSLIYILKNRF